ncbi:MAG: site-2 protease family protein [Salinirussus sp.]
MDRSDPPTGGPPVADIESVFDVYEVRRDGETLLYVGRPLASARTVERELWPLFRDCGYELSLEQGYDGSTATETGSGTPLTAGEYVLVARPQSVGIDGIPWTNVVLLVVTILSTLLVGATQWYGIPLSAGPLAMLEAWPFVAAVLGVLGIHELGHYVVSRYYDVDATLPYFIPFPSLIGSMGAVIRMKGRIPNRRALFDIGVAGPLAGLLATVVVTAIGLQLDPLPAAEAAAESGGAAIRFNNPALLVLIGELTGTSAKVAGESPVHPVVFGGWVGMFVTFLNLLPVGQLDGGHIVRAIAGERQETLAAAVPGALFALAGYLYFVRGTDESIGIWVLWGVFALGLAYAGPADPIYDEPLGRGRIGLGIVTLVLGLLCFTPVPIEVVGV